jgi:hypothetical protein
MWSGACVLLLFAGAKPGLAGGGPETLALVVNADHPDSVAIAEEYMRLRGVPESHVVRLAGVPAEPVIDVATFRERILKPVLGTISERGLAPQTDYVVYSAGFPYAVNVQSDVADRQLPRVLTQPASLSGLTYLHELVIAGDPTYLALDANRYWRRLGRQQADKPWTGEEQAQREALQGLLARWQDARRAAPDGEITPEMRGWLENAAAISQTLASGHPASPELLYDLACVLALLGKADDAMAALQSAYGAGWWNADHTAADPDLVSLRDRDDFRALLQALRDVVVQTEPPRPFRAATAWDEDGQPASEGRRYLISAMLAYTGGPANTLDEALASLRASAAADGTRPGGTIYYMASADTARTGPRRWAFPSAIQALAQLGVRGEELEGVLPPGKVDVAGAAVGAAGFSWADSGSRILPGAFCDHLTSFGGVMTGAGQTLLSEFIRHGAAGACGTVTEPYNVPAKFPTPFLHVFYASGCSLGEAFYQSVHGPYQQLLVGDPLCQPWARIPQVTVKELTDGQTLRQPRKLVPVAGGAEAPLHFELHVDGRRVATCEPGQRLVLDPRGLATGEHEAAVVAVAGPLETRGREVVRFSVASRPGG